MSAVRVLAALAVTSLLATGCGPTTTASSAPTAAALAAQADAVPTPEIAWAPCAEPGLAGDDCARVPVPLDYARPDGPAVDLAVVRQRALDPAHRIGTLFTAAGGPGSSGIDWAAGGPMFPGVVSERFDVVTFDQRGIGRSAAVRCFADSQAQQDFWLGLPIPPTDGSEEQAVTDGSARFAEGCAEFGGDLIAHLTTADAARDLELLRRAVGDPALTYEGGSYASYLGMTYGALFPDRVRALHLSSIVDSEGYTLDTRADIARTARGTEEVRVEFARLCAEAGVARCPFGGGSADHVLTRDTSLLEQSAAAPIQVGSGDTAITVTHSQLVHAHAMLLYRPDQGWPALAALLSELAAGPDGDPEVVGQVLGAVTLTGDFLDSFVAISCADNAVGRHPHRWPEFAADSAAQSPFFGPFWLYLRQPCATWPMPEDGFPQRFPGPWRSSVPALLVNNRFDPATPLSGAERAAQALGGARLVVVTDGYGHEPTGDCVTELRERYLVDLVVPAAGTTCTVDRLPFAD
ncbi:alpha/beta hydrolase [Nocardia sp. SSK8]|uniref:alpha/beta hydrolase n=1 Tax=Nocardia sp. SSK8 TaxID=3120154 RepID=UPI00300A7865